MTAHNDDWIHLAKVVFPCMVGLFEWEQRQTQRLELDVALNLDLDPAAGGELGRTVNYALVLDELQFIAQHGRFRLLESLAAAMARHLLAEPAQEERRARVDRVVVRVAKPEIFPGRAVPMIEIRRAAPFGALEFFELGVGTERARMAPLQETAETGAYRVVIAPGAAWTVPTSMAIYVLAGVLERDRAPLRAGETLARGGHRVVNPGPGACHLIGVSQPPIRRADA